MLPTSLTLALRNTRRHRTRSAIAIWAITFSVIALLLAGGFAEWVLWTTREAAIRTGLGHIRAMRPDFDKSGLANPGRYLLPERSPELSALERIGDVRGVAPRLNFSGLVSHGETTLAFVGEGVMPEKEQLLNEWVHIAEGSDLASTDPHGVLVGVGLATNLGVRLGDKVVLLNNTSSGSVNAVEGRVRGLVRTGIKAYDDAVLRVPIAMSRELLRVSGEHVWVISLARTEDTQRVLDQLRAQFRNARLEFIPWFELSDFYTKTVALLSSQMNAVRFMMGVIILLSISNTLVMSVLERTGEIGTMMAMGTRRRGILSLFLTEGLLLGLLGGVFGLAVGVLLAHIISAIGIPMPPPPGLSVGYSAEILLTGQLVAGTLALAVGTTVLASLYPAWKASRLTIVDALRRNR
jgi:putative ABC transport system permease protein